SRHFRVLSIWPSGCGYIAWCRLLLGHVRFEHRLDRSLRLIVHELSQTKQEPHVRFILAIRRARAARSTFAVEGWYQLETRRLHVRVNISPNGMQLLALVIGKVLAT